MSKKAMVSDGHGGFKEVNKPRNVPEKVTVYHIETGKAVKVFSVDAREYVKTGEYTTEPPEVKGAKKVNAPKQAAVKKSEAEEGTADEKA